MKTVVEYLLWTFIVLWFVLGVGRVLTGFLMMIWGRPNWITVNFFIYLRWLIWISWFSSALFAVLLGILNMASK